MTSRYAGLAQTKTLRRSHAGRVRPRPTEDTPSDWRMASARSFARSFSPGSAPPWLTEAVTDASRVGLNSGAVTGRSKGMRLRTGETSDEISASGVIGSADAGCTLTLVWHLGHRTVNGRDGAFASSSCKRASHFEQMRTMIVFHVIWVGFEVIQYG